MTLQTIIDDSRTELAVPAAELAAAIDAIAACAAACASCSAACLAEDEVADLRDCIASDDVCAEVCRATVAVLTRLTRGSWAVLDAQLAACETATRACAEACRAHAAHHEHCAACAEACDRAHEAARSVRSALPS